MHIRAGCTRAWRDATSGCHTCARARARSSVRVRVRRTCVVCARARARAFCATLRYLRWPTRSASPRRSPRCELVVAYARLLCDPAARSRTVVRCSGRNPGEERSAPAANRRRTDSRCDFPSGAAEQVEGASSGPARNLYFCTPWKGHVTYAVSIDLGRTTRASVQPSRNAATGPRTTRGERGPGRGPTVPRSPCPLAAFREVMGEHVSCNFWLHPSCTKLFPCLSLLGFGFFFSFFL